LNEYSTVIKEDIKMKKTYLLEDLCCANCAAAIERGIAKIECVQKASVSFLTT
jgi:copper chaperone CopZ